VEILLTMFRFLGVSSKTSTNLEHSNCRKEILDWKEKKLLDFTWCVGEEATQPNLQSNISQDTASESRL
jgi:hypothetical protein